MSSPVLHRLAVSLALSALAASAGAAPLRLTWLHAGSESRNSAQLTADQLRALPESDVWAVGGLQPDWQPLVLEALRDRSSAELEHVSGTTGASSHRMLLAWNGLRLRLLDDDVERLNLGVGQGPAPLVGRFLDLATDVELHVAVFSTNVLSTEQRAVAARRLVEWAEQQDGPIVLAGDIGRGVRIDGTGRDPSINTLTSDRIFEWQRPRPLERTDCNLSAKGAVRDAVLLGGSAREWNVSVRGALASEEHCARWSPPCCWEPPRCRSCGAWRVPLVAELTPEPPVSARQMPLASETARPLPAPGELPEELEKSEVLRLLDALQLQVDALRRRVERWDD